MEDDDEVVRFLREQLLVEEQKLSKMEAPVERQREIVRRRRAALAAAQSGTFSSRDVTDDEIVAFLVENASESSAMLAPDIAHGLGLDTRGLSRRLPRMADDKLIAGSPKTGYWTPAWR